MSARHEYTTLTPPQYRAALALAAAHSHQWASAELDAAPTTDVSDAAIAAESDAMESHMPGIGSPGVDPKVGSTGHTTATGRLSWCIDRLGNVELDVSRPGRISVLWGTWSHASGPMVGHYDLPIYARHVRALEDALRALDPAAAADICRPLWVRCDDIAEVIASARAVANGDPGDYDGALAVAAAEADRLAGYAAGAGGV